MIRLEIIRPCYKNCENAVLLPVVRAVLVSCSEKSTFGCSSRYFDTPSPRSLLIVRSLGRCWMVSPLDVVFFFQTPSSDSRVILTERLGLGKAVSRCVVAGISLVDTAVMLDNVVLDFLPELLHSALRVLMVDW